MMDRDITHSLKFSFIDWLYFLIKYENSFSGSVNAEFFIADSEDMLRCDDE